MSEIVVKTEALADLRKYVNKIDDNQIAAAKINKERFDKIDGEISGIKDEISGIKDEISGIKDEISGIKEGQKAILDKLSKSD